MMLALQPVFQDGTITALCLFSAYFLYSRSKLVKTTLPSPSPQPLPQPPNAPRPSWPAYILTNQVHHARLLPLSSSHSFDYTTVCLLLSLNALESGSLDLCKGYLFGYGGGVKGRVAGLRSEPYLMATMHMENEKGGIRREGNGKGMSMSIKEKLVEVLRRRGYLELRDDSDEDGGNLKELEDAWMMTMPSYLGFEGINPLTVYFCYRPGGVLWLVVLEVHNTFGESHVYLLEIGKGEDPIDPSSSKRYDHRWTFPRAFHVSPFNDRQGFYTVSIKRPSHPPSLSIPASSSPPLPTISIHLHVPSSSPTSTQIQTQTSSLSPTTSTPGPLKLTALLRPVSSVPLTAPNLLWTLSRYPVGLLLSLPRILYQAWVLHYRKKLDVYIRPEPFCGG
ncbi:hypothetical protein K435DRAFT_186558 [Dendrothele bispora CBS 962.96]|uniref:DUF1365-domain-containing protein n=1 Tax=Dendrothele bispora (strain CBS 962.96) TaxID=1314807 RepID=A0A4S8KKT3_DENBC|nr:hypothetical protein K435DRAFT_186558 [Dendrothele bispora CBS 962.96]